MLSDCVSADRPSYLTDGGQYKSRFLLCLKTHITIPYINMNKNLPLFSGVNNFHGVNATLSELQHVEVCDKSQLKTYEVSLI